MLLTHTHAHTSSRFRNVKTLRGHAGVVKCIDYDQDTQRVASGSCDGIIRVSLLVGWCEVSMITKIWDIHKMKKKCLTVLEGHNNWVRGLQMRGNLLVSASSDRTLRAWNVSTKQCVAAYDGHTNYVRCLQFTNNIMVRNHKLAALGSVSVVVGLITFLDKRWS